jgi:hypothetical protein
MDQTEMRKSDTTKQFFPFTERLDALLADASRSGISDLEIAGKLEGRAQSFRERHVMTTPVESANILPKTTVVGGNGNIVQRVSAAIRGEY